MHGRPRRVRVSPVGFAVLLVVGLLLEPGAGVGQGLPRAEPSAVGFSAPRLDSLARELAGYVEGGRLPGGVLLVARHGRVAFLDAFGFRDREARDSMRADDLFRIASQTKAVVSVVAMQLVEEGRLSLDDAVSRWIPEFGEVTVAEPARDDAEAGGGSGYRIVPARQPMTIRHLLSHTSGLGYGDGPAADRWEEAGIQGWYFADRDEPVASTVERMAGLPLAAQPGTRWIYGYSVDVLGVVVERATGLALNAALRAYVFQPLGMEDTWFYPPRDQADRLAVVYSRSGEGLERAPAPGGMVGQGLYVEGPRTSFSGGAGLVSTAGDYARFLQMLLSGGTLDGVRLLSAEGVEAMTTDQTGGLYDGPERGFGLGFEVVLEAGEGDPRTPGSFGWGGAYHSTYWVDPAEDLLVVYLTQVIPAGDVDDFDVVRRGVYDALDPAEQEGPPGPGPLEGRDVRSSLRVPSLP